MLDKSGHIFSERNKKRQIIAQFSHVIRFISLNISENALNTRGCDRTGRCCIVEYQQKLIQLHDAGGTLNIKQDIKIRT